VSECWFANTGQDNREDSLSHSKQLDKRQLVDLVSRLRAGRWRNRGLDYREGKETISEASRPSLGPNQAPVLRISGGNLSGSKETRA
jgi:hypothetical protein